MKRLLVLLLSSLPLFAAESPLVQLVLEPIKLSQSGTSATALAVLRNHTGVALTNIDVDLVLTSGRPTSITAANHPAWPTTNWSCTSTGAQSIRCRLPFMGGSEGTFVPLVVTIDPANEGRFSLTGTATWTLNGETFTSKPWNERAVFSRDVVVTNTLDAGAGSLRAAIEYANDTCTRDSVPCRIIFRIDEESVLHIIRPVTPLPAITASDITIERRSEEPKIELDGSLLTTGHGLQLRGEGYAQISGLAIGGFPWDGIAISRRSTATLGTGIVFCTLGLHPDRTPNPNGSRGVTIDAPASHVGLGGNLIAANRRSGVFIAGAEHVSLQSNVIGRDPYSPDETGFENGASGVFVGPGSRDVRLSTNLIGTNAHMGIAIARGARGVHITNTWAIGSRGLNIDHGLDGFDGTVRNASGFALPAPRIVSATYDAATNKTTVTGTFDAPDPSATWLLTLVGDRGIWPERSLPTATFTGTAFTVAFDGQVPFIGATVSSAQPSDWSTSEYSEPLR